MFESIKRRFNGCVHPTAAYRKCTLSFDNVCANFRSKMGDDTPFIHFFEDDEFRNSFYEYLYQICNDCFAINDRKTQLTNLRRELVKRIDENAIAEIYIAMEPRDRQIITDRLFSQQTKDENDLRFERSKEFNRAAMLILRGISGEYFDDFHAGDWLHVYYSLAKTLYDAKLNDVVAKSVGDVSITGPFIPTLEARREEILEVIYSGDNYQVDPESFDQRDDESAVDDDLVNQDKHRKEIYEDELDDIVDIVWNRMMEITNNELYNLDEFEPKELFRCAVVDVSTIWTIIALRLEDRDKAEGYVHEIVGRALERSGIESQDNDNFEDLMSTAQVLVERNLEIEDRGDKWFPKHLIFSFSFIYDVAISNTPEKKEQQRALGHTAVGLGSFIWPLFADVSNALGDDLSREWFGDAD